MKTFGVVLVACLLVGSLLVYERSSEGAFPSLKDIIEVSFQGEKQEGFTLSPYPLAGLKEYPGLAVNPLWQNAINAGLKNLSSVQFQDLHGKAQELGIQESKKILSLQAQDKAKTQIRIGRRNGYLRAYYASRVLDGEHSFFLLPESFYYALSAPTKKILDAHVVPTNWAIEEFENILVTPHGAPLLRFQREGAEWLVDGKKADRPFVHGFLKALKSLKFSDVASSQQEMAEALPPLFLEIIVQRRGKESQDSLATETVTLYGAKKAGAGQVAAEPVFARRGSLPYLFRLEELPRMMMHIKAEQFLAS